MRRTALVAFLMALLMVLGTPLEAQRRGKDKDEIKWPDNPQKAMALANEYYELQEYTIAKEGYLEVLKKDPENYRAMYRAAKASYFIQQYEDAARYFEGALELNDKNDTALFELGIVYRVLDRQADARDIFTQFRSRWKGTDALARRAKLELKGTEFVEQERKKKPAYEVKCIDINSGAGDQFPVILEQNEGERYLVFTSHRTESMGNEQFFGYDEPAYSDLWITKIEDDTTFGVPETLGKKVNTRNNDGSAAFTPDGLTMYYSICNSGKLGYGCSIYRSKYNADKKAWGKPKLVEELQGEKVAVVDSRGKTKKVPTYDVQPTLSTDGNTMYFVSDRDGGEGNLDIWVATWQGEEWSAPQNLGPMVNTPYDDQSPSISEDGETLIFASRGRVGFGGMDIYSTKGGPGAWEEPVNLGSPINSTYDDFGGYWYHQDSMAYFTSNRPNCTGRDDIYYAKLIPAPPVLFTVHGEVRDIKSGNIVPFATVILFMQDPLDGELIPVDTFETDQSAAYNFELEPDRKYVTLGNAPEYLAGEMKFNTEDVDSNDIEVNINIELERVLFGTPITLENIYYDFDKYDLRPESEDELNKLVGLMDENPNLRIMIGSHTDSNGSESYNKTLSENRAKSVIRYLMNNGILPDRLEWFGFGESQLLIYPEMSDADEQLNRRTEFSIIDL